MIVTFFGHSTISDDGVSLYEKTFKIMREIVEANPDCTFLCGHKGQFDFLCERCIDELKKTFSGVTKAYITPYYDIAYQNNTLKYISKYFDEIIFPPTCEACPPQYAYSRRNQWMSDTADIVIGYEKFDWGGAAASLRYARKRGKRIIPV